MMQVVQKISMIVLANSCLHLQAKEVNFINNSESQGSLAISYPKKAKIKRQIILLGQSPETVTIQDNATIRFFHTMVLNMRGERKTVEISSADLESGDTVEFLPYNDKTQTFEYRIIHEKQKKEAVSEA